jgi:parallel beta-helix repeat protein
MKKYLFVQKGFAVGIIFLFIGTAIIPTSGQKIEKPSPTSRDHWLYVGGSGPGNYTRIQDAIDNATIGDTVFVYDDSSPYMEYVHIDKSIQLIGENKTTTIINSSKQSTLASYNYNHIFSNILVQGFTFLNSCSFTDETYGVDLSSLENFTLNDTIIVGCQWGVHLSYCSDCSVTHNVIRDGVTGIEMYNVDTSDFIGNQVIDNALGIKLISSHDNLFSNNTLMNNGIMLYDYSYPNSFSGNTVNSKPILYFDHESDLIIDNIPVGQLFLIYCKNITVRNIEVSNTNCGIVIMNSENCLVTNTTLHSNSDNAIMFIGTCQNNTISYNNISSNNGGITYGYQEYNNIIGNEIRYNNKGLMIAGTKNTIRDNIVENNGQGLIVSFGSQNLITNNIIANSTTIGLDLGDSAFCQVKSNNFINNQKDASFEKHLIFRNYFQRNYWSPSVGFGPKAIWGLQYIVVRFDFYHGFTYRSIPWVQFDWFPARHPYDIGG